MQIEEVLAQLHEFEVAIEDSTSARNTKASRDILNKLRARVEVVRARIAKQMLEGNGHV